MKTRNAPWLEARERRVLWALAAGGTAAFLAGLALEPRRAWANLLLVNFFLLSAGLGGGMFIAVHYMGGAGWPTLFRRVPESMTAYLPCGAAVTVLLFFGMHELYPWMDAGAAADPVLKGKAAFLNAEAFRWRAVFYAAAWVLTSWRLLRNSRAQDASGDPALTAANVRASAVFAGVFGVTFTLAGIDWVMSLEPHWYSTLYPWYLFSGLFVESLAAMTLLLILLHRRGFCPGLGAGHLHDLGKYLFGFSVFWAYLWFSQYLLIWYSNIPEETAHYLSRVEGAWGGLFWLAPILNFVAPFFLLLGARRKKREDVLLAACVVLLLGHWLDFYMQVMPPVLKSGPRLGWLEAAVLAGGASLFVLLFDRSFASVSSVPIADPTLEESLHHHG